MFGEEEASGSVVKEADEEMFCLESLLDKFSSGLTISVNIKLDGSKLFGKSTKEGKEPDLLEVNGLLVKSDSFEKFIPLIEPLDKEGHTPSPDIEGEPSPTNEGEPHR